MQNTENKGELVVYQSKDGKTEIGVKLDNDDVWLSQQQIARLFNKNRVTITEHLAAIYKEGELDKAATCRNFRQVQLEAGREVNRDLPYYNLDAIISVGYRVNSKEGVQFRQWATKTLKDHLTKGFTYNEYRINQIENKIDILSDNFMHFSHNISRLFMHSASQKKDLAAALVDLDNVKKDVNNIKDILNKRMRKDVKKKLKGSDKEM